MKYFTNHRLNVIFRRAQSQEQYIVELHRMVIGKVAFEEAETIDWIACTEECWKEICKRAMAWDKEHAPTVMAGGAWLNWGFSSIEEPKKVGYRHA